MEAIILAGGAGTRLRPVIGDLPKAMAPIGGRPFLELLLEQLERQGLSRIVLSLGYRREVIRDHFGPRFGRLQIGYAEEVEPLGTGGAIVRALERVSGEHAFVLNGDTLLELDYPAMWRHHLEGAREDVRLTLALREVPDASRYGTAELSGDRITRFRPRGPARPALVNAGVYAVSRRLFDGCRLPAAFSFERDFLEPRAGRIRPRAFFVRGSFVDIGVPEGYRRARRLWEDRGGRGRAAAAAGQSEASGSSR